MCRHDSMTMDGDDDDNLIQVNYGVDFSQKNIFYVQILKLLCDSYIELFSDKTGQNCFLWQ